MKEEQKIILEADVVLPLKETIEVYNIGTKEHPRFIVTEQTVRKELSTHKTCDCGNIYEKNSYCDPCATKRSLENYCNKPFKVWDGTTPLCTWDNDTYLFDIESIEEYLEENELEPSDLQLMICEENNISNIDESYWEDIMPENWDSMADGNKEFVQKLKEFNEFINMQPPFSWREGNHRTIYIREDFE
jgi:hypothetical protein